MRHRNFDELVNNLNYDGIHEVFLDENPYHILIKDLSLDSDWILIGFTGAVDRKKTSPPYFSFKGIAQKCNLGLISISDPTLMLDSSINLAWYFANDINGYIAEKLACFLDSIISKTGKKLLLCGGSGGGFAALNIQEKMKFSNSTKTFVWNPQTNILKYNDFVLKKYCKVAFSIPETENINTIEKYLLMRNFNFKLKNLNLKRIIFINGYDPNHIRKHIRIFTRLNKDSLTSLYVGNWGNGHIGPDKNTICDVIEGLMSEDQKIIQKISNKDSKPILDFLINEEMLNKNLNIRATILRGGSIERILCLKCNVFDFFIGYQIKFFIFDKVKLIYDSGYLLGADVAEIYLKTSIENLRKINESVVKVYIEDINGLSKEFNFSFKDIKEIHDIKKNLHI